MVRIRFIPLFIAILLPCSFPANAQPAKPDSGWISLFNGENLNGWTPKFVGYKAGVNYKNTFRVENGLLTVSYDQYKSFDGTFGHLFYKSPFSHYKIRAVYRFIGEQPVGAGEWAFRNNGLMLHAQSPESMRLRQEFPVSIEVQLLGGKGKEERPTANLCTPGTNVVMHNQLVTQHCTRSNADTYYGNQWVTVEVVVHGSRHIHHIVEGDTVMSYGEPRYDGRNDDARRLMEATGDTLLEQGYIGIQAESHPTQFREILLKPLGE